MEKCIYKASGNMCARSTSQYHCKIVNDEICGNCFLHQDNPEYAPHVLLKQAISKALEVLPMSDNNQPAVEILTEALKIR